jgi:hypothetical protein
MKLDCANQFRAVRLLAWQCARLLLTFSVLGAAAYATPIVSLNDMGTQGSKTAAKTSALQSSAPASPVLAKSTAFSLGHFEEASSASVPDGCVFSGGCSSTLKVPEPQSLVLVGSGLLSMAELIRRRLIR